MHNTHMHITSRPQTTLYGTAPLYVIQGSEQHTEPYCMPLYLSLCT